MGNTNIDEETAGQSGVTVAVAEGAGHANPKKSLSYRFWIAFWAIAFTNLAAAYDSTTLAVALPVMIPTVKCI